METSHKVLQTLPCPFDSGNNVAMWKLALLRTLSVTMLYEYMHTTQQGKDCQDMYKFLLLWPYISCKASAC